MTKHDKEPQDIFPVELRDSQYICPLNETVSSEVKAKFLETFYFSGNLSRSAKLVGSNWRAISAHLDKDPVFYGDYLLTLEAMKHRLEGNQYETGLAKGGYMPSITWLRTKFPQEYNPNTANLIDKKANETVKQLADKLKDYEVIPKLKVINAEEKKDAL